MDKRDLWRIYRRWRDGQSVSRIAGNEGRDRKTIRDYIEAMKRVGLSDEGQQEEEQEFYRLTAGLLPEHSERPTPARALLLPYRDELIEMIMRKTNALKPKYAFQTLKKKHDLAVSYVSVR